VEERFETTEHFDGDAVHDYFLSFLVVRRAIEATQERDTAAIDMAVTTNKNWMQSSVNLSTIFIGDG
jgi:hypothetical protein